MVRGAGAGVAFFLGAWVAYGAGFGAGLADGLGLGALVSCFVLPSSSFLLSFA